MEIGKTERGFQLIEFKDRYNQDCSLQQSSLADAEPPGSSAIWFGTDESRMHLNYDLLIDLMPLLQNWLNHGSFEDKPSPGIEKGLTHRCWFCNARLELPVPSRCPQCNRV